MTKPPTRAHEPTHPPQRRREAHDIGITQRTAMAIAKKIGYQFPATPEGKLMRGVFLRAVDDLFLHTQRRSAVLHLQGRIHEAEWCGIDSDWIRLQFKRAGLTIEEIDP